ncbi:uncharacterized protein LOC141695486 [Apium graveolens]|uniref:uncharacterized protein LOC141695486 n=1 Tax=Apium graveolens TaxID=4045 RepID=UPI003D7C1047
MIRRVNSLIVEKLLGKMSSYFSVDTIDDFPGSVSNQLTPFPPEYLNSIAIPGLPLHELIVKVGVIVMLMYNLNQTLGLCNNTKMKVTRCLDQCVECEVCYAMTINKAQGQYLENLALFLLKWVFTHGQFYVAVSRVTSPQALKLFIQDKDGNTTNITQNVVYKEVFYSLPVI